MFAQLSDSTMTVTHGGERSAADWTDGTLVFRDMRLKDVAAELSRAYGRTIRVDDTVLAKKEMSLDVSLSKQPITRVLDLIGIAAKAHYTTVGTTYVLRPGRVQPSSPRNNPQLQPEKQYGR